MRKLNLLNNLYKDKMHDTYEAKKSIGTISGNPSFI